MKKIKTHFSCLQKKGKWIFQKNVENPFEFECATVSVKTYQIIIA